MFTYRRTITVVFLLTAAMALAACVPGATLTTAPTQPPATSVPPTVVPTAAATPVVVIIDPAALLERCQLSGYQTYQDPANHFCFAYSPRYTGTKNSTGAFEIHGPETGTKTRVAMTLEVKAVPAGSSLKSLVDEMAAAIPADLLRRSPTTLGSEPAELLEADYGIPTTAQVLALRENQLVHLTFSPLALEPGFIQNDFQSLYRPVMSSFTFLDGYTVPAASQRADLPQACQVPDSGLAADPAGGYCYAYPLRFRLDKLFDIYGPLLDPSLEPVQVMLGMTYVAAGQGDTLEKVVDQFLTDVTIGIDLSAFPKITRTPLQLGGEAAVVVEPVPGYGSARFVFTIHNGTVYRLRFWPVDPSTGASNADLADLYQAVVSSFSFIE
jgi:hypothetical protein